MHVQGGIWKQRWHFEQPKYADKLNLEGIVDFPTPISQTPNTKSREKTFQSSKQCLWIHNNKEEKTNKLFFHITYLNNQRECKELTCSWYQMM